MASDHQSGRSRTPKGKNSKGKILDMAEKIFAQKGFVAASISDVVHGLGISAGALYHHFPSKKALLSGIAERSVKKMCEQMDEWVENDDLSPGEKVDRFVNAVEGRRHLKTKLTRMDFGAAHEDTDAHEVVVQTGLEPITARLSVYIEQGNTTGDFNVQRPQATAIMIFLLLIQFMHRSNRAEKIVPREELDRTARDSVNQLLQRKGL